ncbi:MAG: hypothetical protein NT154_23085, partial [Verrucomicrobia bacterium]|nr:hypothetical protein [Verrucomicrobiota bacterium]
MKPNLTHVLLLAGALFGLDLSVRADDPMLNGTGNGGARNNFTGTIGYTFTTGLSDVYVSALGFVDWQSGGSLVSTHEVGIWDGSGTLIASAFVSSGAGCYTNNGFFYTNLTTTVTLAANTTYTIGGQVFDGGDTWPNNGGSSNPGFTAPTFTGFTA